MKPTQSAAAPLRQPSQPWRQFISEHRLQIHATSEDSSVFADGAVRLHPEVNAKEG
jgi:hypothetical protein